MFIPGEPGGRLAHSLFGWIPKPTARLFALYCVSLAGAVAAAFALRNLSLSLTTHAVLPEQKIAAVSFLSGSETRLRGLIDSVRSDREIEDRLDPENGWTLVQALEGKSSARHVMIDAGMSVREVRALPLSAKGKKFVYSHREDAGDDNQPFAVKARWRPFLIEELDDRGAPHIIELPSKLFLGNPVMPIF